MFRLASLVIPHHIQGPTLGVAFVALAPGFAELSGRPGLHNVGILLAALAALVAIKLYLRDGPKAGSLLILGASLGMGTVLFPAFVQVLPWTVLPALAAGRSRRGIMRVAAFAGGAFCFAALAISRALTNDAALLIPGSGDVPVQGAFSAEQALDVPVRFLSSLATAENSRSVAVVALYIFLSLGFLGGILRGLMPAKNRLSWQGALRLAPLIAVVVITGVLSAAGWGFYLLLTHHALPPAGDFFLAGPWIALVAALGFTNLTAWIRSRRSIGNVVAESLVAYVLALQVLANAVCFYLYFTVSTSR
jgi:hypothetical protein